MTGLVSPQKNLQALENRACEEGRETQSLRSQQRLPSVGDSHGQGLPVGHRAVGLVGLAGVASGGIRVRSLLRLVLGLGEEAEGAGPRGS